MPEIKNESVMRQIHIQIIQFLPQQKQDMPLPNAICQTRPILTIHIRASRTVDTFLFSAQTILEIHGMLVIRCTEWMQLRSWGTITQSE